MLVVQPWGGHRCNEDFVCDKEKELEGIMAGMPIYQQFQTYTETHLCSDLS